MQPLDPTSVFTLASAFIVSCPADNPPLPFTPLPGLTYDMSSCNAPKIRKRGLACRAPKPRPGQGGKGDDKPTNTSPDYNNGGHGGKPEHPPYPTQTPVCEKTAGDNIVVTVAGNTTIPAGSYLTFVSGLAVSSVPANVNGQKVNAAIPATAMGQTYVFVTNAAAANNKLDISTVIAGPAIVEGE